MGLVNQYCALGKGEVPLPKAGIQRLSQKYCGLGARLALVNTAVAG